MQAANEHARARVSVERWFEVADAATARSLMELRQYFAAVDQVGNALVFNIAGNNYRLICCVDWRRQWLFLRALLTHAEYDRVNVEDLCR